MLLEDSTAMQYPIARLQACSLVTWPEMIITAIDVAPMQLSGCL